MSMITVEQRDDGVAIIWLDHPEKPVNTLSPAAVEEFNEKVAPLIDRDDVKAMVVVSAKPDTFIAGADLELIEGLGADEISAMSRDGNALLERIATSNKPVVAAVHGAALGGGLEVALACHYILATDDPKTVLAQSEVMLGLLPAGGGTQRLVERVGLVAALPMLLTGKRVRARRAKKMGLVDAITTPGGIAETGARAALALAEGSLKRRPRKKTPMDRLAATGPGRALVLHKAREQVQRQTRGLYPAPPAILDCVETGLKKGRVAGLARESDYFGKLAETMESRNLVRLFHAMNEAKKGLDGEARDVQKLAVLGGGFMGAGVASVSLGLCPVVVRDISDEVLGMAAKTIDDGLKRQVRSGAIRRVESDQRWSRLLLTTEVDDLEGADLVVEAVFEDLELKRRVLAEVEERVADDAVFASNTSALPISEIAAEAKHPERVIGMHYFSPVPKMPLLEIVVADRTAPRTTATAHALGTAQGKTCIVVKDGPGFYTTRILAPYLNEAVLLVEEGARVEDVDRAMKDFGYPVGPLALVDEVGIDVGAHVARDLGRAFAERGLEGSGAMPKLIEAGLHGRKNGRGFYIYPKQKKKKKKKEVNQQVYELLGGGQRRNIAAAEVQERLALLMVNEAVYCLQEGVISSPRDGDLGAILGLGFPPFRGGPFRHVDTVGREAIAGRLKELADKHGKRFEPANLLTEPGEFYQ